MSISQGHEKGAKGNFRPSSDSDILICCCRRNSSVHNGCSVHGGFAYLLLACFSMHSSIFQDHHNLPLIRPRRPVHSSTTIPIPDVSVCPLTE